MTSAPPVPPRIRHIGHCIYCGRSDYADGETRKLGDEHVIPFGLNGDILLTDASCQACERITGHVETITLGHHLIGPRRVMGLQSRTRPARQPKTLPIFAIEPGGGRGRGHKVQIEVDDFPTALFMLPLATPPILSLVAGRPVEIPRHPPFVHWFRYDGALLREKYGVAHWATQSLDMRYFCRMLAKIGHAFAVFELGVDGFTPMLTDIIRDPDRSSRAAIGFIGGLHPAPPAPRSLHEMKVGRATIAGGPTFVVVRLRLFAQFGAPVYSVVVGVPPGDPVPDLPAALAEVREPRNFYRISIPPP
jgi:hypothetical protein